MVLTEQRPPSTPRRRGRRALRVLSSAMIVAGALLVVDAVLTLLWQEPLSALYTGLEQRRLDDKLGQLERRRPTPLEQRALARLPPGSRRLAFAARALDRRTRPGDPIGRLRVPSVGISKVFVAGTNGPELRKGPGHYPDTPLPGVHGTVAIAGHRTTYGAPFRKLDDIDRGDRIEVEMPYGTFTYAVERTRIVPPTAVWVTHRVSYDRLVLSACHPLYSDAQRIVVFARLQRSDQRA
jgi:sortase A